MYPPTAPPQLPRYVDAQLYAQWAVRRIGRAFALALLGPVAITGLVLLTNPTSDAVSFAYVIGSALCVLGAILSLCFAKAPG